MDITNISGYTLRNLNKINIVLEKKVEAKTNVKYHE